jgi:chromosome segregation ATPase
MSTKPSNWWGMSLDERREWERHDRAVENAEYETQRAREDAERSERHARDLRRQIDASRFAAAEEIATVNDLVDELEGEVAELKERVAALTGQRDALLAVCRRRFNVLVTASGTRDLTAGEHEEMAALHAAIDKAEGRTL